MSAKPARCTCTAAALNDPQGGMGGNDWHAWHDAVSVDAMKVSEATPLCGPT